VIADHGPSETKGGLSGRSIERIGHNHIGHNHIGHNDIGHNDIGHNDIGHNDIVL